MTEAIRNSNLKLEKEKMEYFTDDDMRNGTLMEYCISCIKTKRPVILLKNTYDGYLIYWDYSTWFGTNPSNEAIQKKECNMQIFFDSYFEGQEIKEIRSGTIKSDRNVAKALYDSFTRYDEVCPPGDRQVSIQPVWAPANLFMTANCD